MMRFPRSRRLLRPPLPERREIIYFGPEKGKKASALGPTMKTSSRCLGANSHDIRASQATCRSHYADREIRAIWRALAREPARRARAADERVGDPERRRSVQFLAPGRCDRRHQDRIFFAGAVVCHPGDVRLDPQRAAIAERSLGSSANFTRSSRPLPAQRPQASPSLRSAAASDADRILAGSRT